MSQIHLSLPYAAKCLLQTWPLSHSYFYDSNDPNMGLSLPMPWYMWAHNQLIRGCIQIHAARYLHMLALSLWATRHVANAYSEQVSWQNTDTEILKTLFPIPLLHILYRIKCRCIYQMVQIDVLVSCSRALPQNPSSASNTNSASNCTSELSQSNTITIIICISKEWWESMLPLRPDLLINKQAIHPPPCLLASC